MAVRRAVRCKRDDFARAQTFTTTPTGDFGWTIADTSAAGAPTYLCITADGGAAKLTLEATSEAQNVCLYQGDVLPFDLAKIQRVRFIAEVAAVNSVTTLVMGVGSARNDTPDTVSINAWFRMEGSASTSNVVCETDDGTNDNDDKATGTTLAAVAKEFVIDFTNGITDVRFFIDGAAVATATTFSMSAITAGQNVQLIFQLQKASGTGVPSVTIYDVEIEYNEVLGA